VSNVLRLSKFMTIDYEIPDWIKNYSIGEESE
jgi:hypothetical protein